VPIVGSSALYEAMCMAKGGGKVVGIDLGTTFSAVAYLDRRGLPVTIPNAEGELTTPSVVLFDKDETVAVGRRALRACLVHPDRVATCVKREMGEPFCRDLIAGRQMSPVHVSSLILKKLKQDAEKKIGPIAGAVITVPAYFDEARRQATASAGAIAGLEVLDVLNEPTAAALAYGFYNYMEQGGDGRGLAEAARGGLAGSGTFVVYDLGGGTFDVTVIRIKDEEFRVLATDGDVRLGGKDWDDRLLAHAAKLFIRQYGADPREDPHSHQELALAVEEAKRDLSSRPGTEFTVNHGGNRLVVTITREQFDEMTGDLLFRTESRLHTVLASAALRCQDVTKVLLVGGSTRMPQVMNMLRRAMEQQPDDSLSADEVVAQGAAIQAAINAVTGKQAGQSPAEGVGACRVDFGAINPAGDPLAGAREEPVAPAASASSPAGREESQAYSPASMDPAGPPGNKLLDVSPGEDAFVSLAPDCDYEQEVSDVLSELRTINVNAHSLGVVARSPRTGRSGTSILIARNSPLPASCTKVFGAATENTRTVVVQIVEGESKDPKACVSIGQCVVGPLPQGLRRGSPISIVFTYDNSGRLHVKARDDTSGMASETVIIRQSLLSRTEVAAARRLVGGMTVY
jgi:molecular chaperone DnaK